MAVDGLIIPRSYSEYINKTDSATLQQALQQSGVLDSAPTEDSVKAVKSGGVFDALAGKQPTLTFDNVPTEDSDNPVKSGGIFDALATKQDMLTFDDAPTADSNNPVKSGGINQAIQDTITYASYDYPSTNWAPGMTSVDVTNIMNAYLKTGYHRYPIAYSRTQNYLQVSFSPVLGGNYYMNVYNGYSGALASSIEIDFIYIKTR